MFVMTRLDSSAFQVRFERPKLPIADSPSIGAGPMVYPARFEHAVGPTKPIEGVVRDRATGRPLPGAVIMTVAVYERDGNREGWGNLGGGSATADAQGRFRLVGAPKSRDLGVHVFPPEGQPYLERMERVGDTPGLAPIVHDVSLTRGIPVRGRLVDRESGRPVRGVVQYFLLEINPRYDELRYSLSLCRVPTGDDGSFSIVALDGPGLLAASRVLPTGSPGAWASIDSSWRNRCTTSTSPPPSTRSRSCSMPWSSSICPPTRVAWSVRSSSSRRSDAGRMRARSSPRGSRRE